ncbi:MAG: hypothetical protein WKG07_49190 [Hymenobacter sp.]
MGLQAKTARVVRPGGQEVDVPIEQVQLGDVVVVRPGEKVATDGVITERPLGRGRGHAHRRKPARRKESRRPGVRGHAQ